ncbi:MAG TPA: carboxypeptidase regulatory-like domain-containing protein [Gemmatimonadaceae bacterium]|nr:carboxypeptidase regulatory-like domain-containing protein [Gemmatimonadaceae bacterium]
MNIRAVLVALLAALVPLAARAQGVTTGAVSGRVLDDKGVPVVGASISVVNTATGAASRSTASRDGRYLVQGLEVGGPYTITARHPGYLAQMRDGQMLTLSQNLTLDFRLERQTIILSTVTVTTETDPIMSADRTGAATVISDSALRRLPSLNRTFTDFVILSPEVSDAGPGLSGAGVNNRLNNIQIDGASENDLFGLGDTGQPGGQARGKSIGLEAVREYQVLVAPFDVRQGNFGGLLVNAVTRGGTNELHGSAFYLSRSEGLARNVDYVRDQEYSQKQFGFSVGGPIIKDRVHFFVAPEFQRRFEPALGPYLGQRTAYPAAGADIGRFQSVLGAYGIDAGSAGPARNANPLRNIFARLDVSPSVNNRLVLRHNYGRAEDDVLARDQSLIRLTSNSHAFTSVKGSTVAQLFTSFEGGAGNELIVGYNRIRDRRHAAVLAPQVQVDVPSLTGGTVRLRAGAENSSQGTEVDQDVIEITDNVTVPAGRHRLTAGTKNEFYRIRNLFAQNSYGVWEFSSLDSLAAGNPSRYQAGVGLGGPIDAAFDAAQLGLYVQDRWQATDRLVVTGGVRLDVPYVFDKPVDNPTVLAQYGRHTNRVPSGNIQISPRIGFNWNRSGDRQDQLRGGVGVFVGRPAFVWIGNAFQNAGTGLAQLTCVATGSVPRFTSVTAGAPPEACANGATAARTGDIALLSNDLRFPQFARASLAYDWRMGHAWVASVEGMYTRAMSTFFYTNHALAGAQGLDRNGRVLYGSIAPTGVASPTLVGERRNVIDVQNASKDYSYSLTASLNRRFTNWFEAHASYTYEQARDIQSLTSSTATSNWRFGRALSGDQYSQNLDRSRFELPHRVVAFGTFSLSTRTDASIIYLGRSGSNYDFVYGASGGAGDLNADGSQGNDLVYIPADVARDAEIRFSGVSPIAGADNSPAAQAARIAEQRSALERFITSTDCLTRQRGRIMTRNSCRSPWTNTVNLSVRQALPAIRGQSFTVQLDVFNFLNLINADWGQQPLPPAGGGSVPLLTHVGQTPGAVTGANGSQGIFTFDPATQKYDRRHVGSAYQMQLGVRYGF